MIPFLRGETITVVPGTIGADNNGDPIQDTRPEHDIAGCGIEARYSTEPTERGRQGVIVGVTVYAPFGSDVLSTDNLRIRGSMYAVDGEPFGTHHPMTGWEPGMEITARKAVG